MQTTERKKRSTARRGNGEGSISQRPDGRWRADISMGFDPTTGKRLRRTVYGWTKKEVQDELTKLQGQKTGGTLLPVNKMTLGEFLTTWLEETARPNIRAATYECYESTIRLHISPKIGGVKLDKVTPAHIQGLYSALERDKVSCYKRRHCHAVLHRALKQAVKWRTLSWNACDAVEAPRVNRSEVNPLTPEQSDTLLAAAKGDRLEALYFTGLTTGMRLGELFGLQWSDVDLEAGVITVRHALQERKGKLTLGEPKTAKSRRRVELSPMAVDALHEHRRRQLKAGHLASGYVFTNTEGNPLRRSHFHRYSFKPLLKKAKLPDIRFHDLRHTSATLLLLGGMNPKIVSERLGHSQIGITLDIYSHALPTLQKEAANCFDRLLTARVG
jgi:integrase